jgi:phosphate transport system permease protein
MGIGDYTGFISLSYSDLLSLIAGIVIALVSAFCAIGFWKHKNWAKTIVSIISVLVIAVFAVSEVFAFSTVVFSGEEITPIPTILSTLAKSILNLVVRSAVPVLLLLVLKFLEDLFLESQAQRNFIDKFVKRVLVITASSSVLIVSLIFIFTFIESTDAISEIGLDNMLMGTIWRPGATIGDEESGQFGLIPMILGSVYSTLGAVILGVPLSIFTAILLAEIAPPTVRDIFRPAVELLAGIPSVIFGLFGMVVLAPLIRNFEVSGNSGFGILNASIILAIMILPTITNVAEDAIRAVPDAYRHASLAMGATHWQTIVTVVLPAARSGIIAAIILGIGRALGETMALIMVIGNSIAIPTPLDDNPLTILLATARTLTGNIAVEINYAAGIHRSALFFTGILLFLLLLLINRLAHFVLRERHPS